RAVRMKHTLTRHISKSIQTKSTTTSTSTTCLSRNNSTTSTKATRRSRKNCPPTVEKRSTKSTTELRIDSAVNDETIGRKKASGTWPKMSASKNTTRRFTKTRATCTAIASGDSKTKSKKPRAMPKLPHPHSG